jgi:hypothetical protein
LTQAARCEFEPDTVNSSAILNLQKEDVSQR